MNKLSFPLSYDKMQASSDGLLKQVQRDSEARKALREIHLELSLSSERQTGSVRAVQSCSMCLFLEGE
jgi:hypothetical protein